MLSLACARTEDRGCRCSQIAPRVPDRTETYISVEIENVIFYIRVTNVDLERRYTGAMTGAHEPTRHTRCDTTSDVIEVRAWLVSRLAE